MAKTPREQTKKASTLLPGHLSESAQSWCAYVLKNNNLDDNKLRLLILAAEAWDRSTVARETIAKEGIIYVSRLGEPQRHPAVAIKDQAENTFARLVKQLDLKVVVAPIDPLEKKGFKV